MNIIRMSCFHRFEVAYMLIITLSSLSARNEYNHFGEVVDDYPNGIMLTDSSRNPTQKSIEIDSQVLEGIDKG